MVRYIINRLIALLKRRLPEKMVFAGQPSLTQKAVT